MKPREIKSFMTTTSNATKSSNVNQWKSFNEFIKDNNLQESDIISISEMDVWVTLWYWD